MVASENTKWLRETILFAVAAISATAALSVCFFKRKSSDLNRRVRELEISFNASLENCAAERQGRIRAQQDLRKALMQHNSEKSELNSYPMTPIAFVHSCFCTRNGTPRQPLLVPLARACLIFDPGRVPPATLEGLGEYSHCWILYVFHLNTNLEKLWKQPSGSKFKAKVKVPRLKGGKKGVFATRSPHRPCPIGLTVAKVEAVKGHMVLLSGVDLVDGTPVLDIKPYLPYSDSIQGATVPEWVKVDNMLAVASVNFTKDFISTLTNCWVKAGKKSLYASPEEFQILIKQVLSWDVRSLSQRNRPHNALIETENHLSGDLASNWEDERDENSSHESVQDPFPSPGDIIYHLMLDGLNVSYKIDANRNVIVEKATLSSDAQHNNSQTRCNYMMWRDKLG